VDGEGSVAVVSVLTVNSVISFGIVSSFVDSITSNLETSGIFACCSVSLQEGRIRNMRTILITIHIVFLISFLLINICGTVKILIGKSTDRRKIQGNRQQIAQDTVLFVVLLYSFSERC
jgi:hypothetical protein